jgi:hypothetical protein
MITGWHLLHGIADKLGYLRAHQISATHVNELPVRVFELARAFAACEDIAEYAQPIHLRRTAD